MPRPSKWSHLAILALACAGSARAADAPATPTAIDFSYAGYGGGGVTLPAPTPTLRVEPTGRDDTRMLQAVVDEVAARTPGADGIRGVILLTPGQFRVQGQLRLSVGGIVLRGSGADATTIRATGTGRRTLIEVRPLPDPSPSPVPAIQVTEDATAGANRLTLCDVIGLSGGDRVVVTRPCTAAWIAALGMDTAPGNYANLRITWLEGSRELVWDRRIASVDPEAKRVTLDAPITTALERRFGGGTVARVAGTGPMTQVGIEAMTLESDFDPARPKDEDHSWIALAIDGTEDVWVRDVRARHFTGSAVRIGPRARRITVERCRSEAPVSEVGGWRRDCFLVEGQQVLVRDCSSEAGLADFAVGLCAGGPNVFLDCRSHGSLGASGSLESWASGTLYERVKIDGAALRLTYDMARRQGAGWTAANSLIWNCEAQSLEAKGPEGAPNVVVRSEVPCYESSLQARGKSLMASELPPVSDAGQVPAFRWQEPKDEPPAPPLHKIEIVGGRFVVDDHVLWGDQLGEGWWRGQATPKTAMAVARFQVTRWVPGREGPGLTEDLPALAARMEAEGTPFLSTLPGLWYDRRRDEHSVAAREDGNVWAPFSEMPWARSGQGTAWDGLSKYDVSKYNPWYYARLREFARLSARHGLVLHHNLYNTHNLLEILPHWVDFPWRPANNINETGLPEPPPVERGNRLNVGNQFYSTENPSLRELHRTFIRHELDELGAEPNVIFSTGFQFVGPLAFQQFFQDTVAEWEEAHNTKVKLALMTTKDITDAILEDPVRSRQIAVVDLKYWQYRPDGSLFAPPGGRNLAFREMLRQTFPSSMDSPPGTTPEQAYRQVREYRDRYPHLALLAWHNDVGTFPALMAGAAQVLGGGQVPGRGQVLGGVPGRPSDGWVRAELGRVLMTMMPRDGVVHGASGAAWCLTDEGMRNLLLYSTAGATMTLDADLSASGYTGTWVKPSDGSTQASDALGPWTEGKLIPKPDENAWVLYLKGS